MRPFLGGLETTRLARFGGYLEPRYAGRFRRKLSQHLINLQCTDVHIVPHSHGDFHEAFQVARELNLRVHVSIHDDIHHTAADHPLIQSLDQKLGIVWNGSTSRAVISAEMGRELCNRYGDQPFIVHTDGAETADSPLTLPASGNLQLYFMGMFLHAYYPNFSTLCHAMARHNESSTHLQKLELKARTVGFRPPDNAFDQFISVLPFASHDVVKSELRAATFAYLPLPFGPEYTALNRFSFSTKLVSYLASGVPILYHGPSDTAAACYIRTNNAGLVFDTLDSDTFAEQVATIIANPERYQPVSEAALISAQRDFDPPTLRQRFWRNVGYSV